MNVIVINANHRSPRRPLPSRDRKGAVPAPSLTQTFASSRLCAKFFSSKPEINAINALRLTFVLIHVTFFVPVALYE